MKPFEYDKMTAEELQDFMLHTNTTAFTFARITGSDYRRVQKWVSGQEDIPVWVYIITHMMRKPGMMAVARTAAGDCIRFDNRNPDKGEYPYMKG